MQEQHGVLVPSLDELPATVLHQEGVSVVHGVTQLEGEHGVRAQVAGALTQLGGRQAPLVQAVVPRHLIR